MLEMFNEEHAETFHDEMYPMRDEIEGIRHNMD